MCSIQSVLKAKHIVEQINHTNNKNNRVKDEFRNVNKLPSRKYKSYNYQ